ncbi:MAG: hypothetical protein ABIH25_05645 [Candidatus Woesearchaeota archaeon]
MKIDNVIKGDGIKLEFLTYDLIRIKDILRNKFIGIIECNKDLEVISLWFSDIVPDGFSMKKSIIEKWNMKKIELKEKQKVCPDCKKNWLEVICVLHHKNKNQEIDKLTRISLEIEKRILKGYLSIFVGYNLYKDAVAKYVKYYKSLKDTKILCWNCHGLEHQLKKP